MKVYKNGKEVKNAIVRYDESGHPQKVVNPKEGKIWQPASEFEFRESTLNKKTRKGIKKRTKK